MVADIGAYEIRAFDQTAYKRSVLSHRLERFVTFYDVAFASEGSGQGDLLAVACSNGQIRLYRSSDLKASWLGGQQPGQVHALWHAHDGPVNCLAIVGTGPAGQVLLSGGEDGHVRAWRLPTAPITCAHPSSFQIINHQLPQHAQEHHQQQQHTQQQGQQQQQDVIITLTASFPPALLPPGAAAGAGQLQDSMLQPLLDVKLPLTESALGALASGAASPAVLCMQHDGGSAVYVGCSDGGCHALDLASVLQLSASSSVQGHSTAATAIQSMPGHAAAVTCLDWCSATGMLATGSEDGTIRFWDPRVSDRAVKVLDPGSGIQIPDTPADCLKCVAHPHVSCVRFDSGGSWLVIGTGGSSSAGVSAATAASSSSSSSKTGNSAGNGWLGYWSMTLGSMVRRVALSAVPQALAVSLGDVLVVGAEPSLAMYRFSGDSPTRQTIGIKSVFGLAVSAASGEVAVAGVGGALELRSQYGRKLGVLHYVSAEE